MPGSSSQTDSDENTPHIITGISNDSKSDPQQPQLNRSDPEIRAAKIHFILPGCPKKVLLDINWHPPTRRGAFKLRTKVVFADDTLEQAEQVIFLFIFPEKVQHLSLQPIRDPVQADHTHILHFDFKSPPTFVSPTNKLDGADPDSSKTIKLFSDLVNFPTLRLPLSPATMSLLPATTATLATDTNLAMLEDMCKAFAVGNGMTSILSCLSVSTLYKGTGGLPDTPAQFPNPNPPDYISSQKRPASHLTAPQPSPRQRPRLDGQFDSILGPLQPQTEQHELGFGQFEELSRRIDTVAQEMESYRTTTDARLQSMLEAHSDIQSRQHRSLTDEIDAQRARSDVLLARSDAHRARSDAYFHATMEQIESQRAGFDGRLQAMRDALSDSQSRRLGGFTQQLDAQRDRSDARLQLLTDQLDSMRAQADVQTMQLRALNEESRSDLSRRLDSLTGQIQAQNANHIRLIESLADRVETLLSNQARRIEGLEEQIQTRNNDQARRIDSLAERVETLASNQTRLVEGLAERIGHLEEDIRSTSNVVRHNQRHLSSVEAELRSPLNRRGCDNIQIGENLTQDLKQAVHRREQVFREEI